MKLNNRGVTLTELIISVVLITIIMGLMYRLILDVTNMQNNDSFASKNQLKRNEIIKTIENDLITMDIKGIRKQELSDKTIIDFCQDDNNGEFIINNICSSLSNLEIHEDSIQYTSSTGKKNKWIMEDATINFKKINVISGTANDIYSLLFDIEVYTENDANNNCSGCTNNIIDDITISYTGKVGTISNINESMCFGYDC